MISSNTFDTVLKLDSYVLEEPKRIETNMDAFAEIAPDLNEIKDMIDEMVAIAERQQNITPYYIAAINKYINDFNEKADAIILYKSDPNSGDSTYVRDSITTDTTNWINAIYNGSDIDHNPYGFMVLYNSLKLNALFSFQKDKLLIEQLKADLELSTQKANELVTRLQSSTITLSPYDYSAALQKQALKHHPRKDSQTINTLLQFIFVGFIVWFIIYFISVYFG